jgi:acyl-CoA thioester hydrolase
VADKLTLAGIETYRGVAYPWLCDGMGHVNVQFYGTLYDGASWHFLSKVAPAAELGPNGLGWADVRQLIEYKREVQSGTLLVVRTRLVRLGTKSVEYAHGLHDAEDGVLYSTNATVTVLFDLEARRAAPLTEAMRARCTKLLAGTGDGAAP